jgi:hypothetical protein
MRAISTLSNLDMAAYNDTYVLFVLQRISNKLRTSVYIVWLHFPYANPEWHESVFRYVRAAVYIPI